jgi:serine O-acetyltransferase
MITDIMNNVTISLGAKVLGPVVIAENSVISAIAIVTKDVPCNCIVY